MPLTATEDGKLRVNGELTLESVGALFSESEDRFSGTVRVIDLSGVTRTDSAGLALLLEWQSRASRRNDELRFTGVPRDLRRLAELSECTDLLGLEEEAGK